LYTAILTHSKTTVRRMKLAHSDYYIH